MPAEFEGWYFVPANSAHTSSQIIEIWYSSSLDLCRFDKTSAGEAREVAKCDINKVVIGKVR